MANVARGQVCHNLPCPGWGAIGGYSIAPPYDYFCGMRFILTLLSVAALLPAVGCKGPPARAEVSGAPDSLTYAPKLGVQLDSMEKRANGLYVRDRVVGTGAVADSMSTVVVHYTGSLADGSVFDSSVGKEPIRFTLGIGQVIVGWDRGLKGMRVGGKRQLVIPPLMAYGEYGMRPVIPGYATLIFDVELMDIVPANPTGLVPPTTPAPKPAR
jgi:FKBP-type peptidyl-prolyl cis-trans isomerase FkpA